jgi:hypothetical protein
MCQASYDVAETLAGKAIRCRQCGEWGRVPSPKVAPPPPSPPAPPGPRPTPPSGREPWYYDFLERYAFVTLALGAVASVPIFMAATGPGGWSAFLVGLAGVFVFLSGCFTCAFLLLLVDMGRSLRLMRTKEP